LSRYTADSRDRVREAVDMVALVSARTELRRAGPDEYVGRCPFHDERTPSFGVDPFKKVYHCFGCQASGDVFNFVMETEGLDFAGALEALAERFGVQLETEAEDPRAAARRQRRERLHELLGRAADYYARYLWEAREAAGARGYLLGRGLSEEILREFRVGYAPSAWDRILTASRRAGFNEEELLTAGLVQRSKSRPGQVYDRFRERIMFPSADARGRVLGFGARAMRENQRPKYLNTSDGELYHKRSQLFGIHLARAAAARAGRIVLVEGYTDVLALHQAGLRNAVGIMGTALTEEQVAELQRIASVLELCLDADRAGQDAMLRAATIARGRGLELRVVGLPEGMDPAELIEREGAEALRERVEGSVPFVTFHVERILARADTGTVEGSEQAFRELQPVLRELPGGVLRDELLRRVASRLEISEKLLPSLVSTPGATLRSPDSRASGSPVAALGTSERAERRFLVMCVALPEAGDRALAEADIEQLLRTGVYRRAARHLAGRCASPLGDLPADDEELARVVADLVGRAGRAGNVTPDHVEHERLVLERARIERAILRARAEAPSSIPELARQQQQIRDAIHRVDTRLEKAV
jgi:DNA primase